MHPTANTRSNQISVHTTVNTTSLEHLIRPLYTPSWQASIKTSDVQGSVRRRNSTLLPPL